MDEMFSQVFVLANPYTFLPGTDGQLRKMSECPSDMAAYWRLGEYLVKQFENSSDTVGEQLLFA
jgi:hypothetical protein